MTGPQIPTLASQAIEALRLRQLRDSGRLTEKEYVERLGLIVPVGGRRLPSAWEILENCFPPRVQKKSA
jgi:hypothetical protein